MAFAPPIALDYLRRAHAAGRLGHAYLNTQAANAFLKTLEEPPADSLLLLVSSLPESLPETILSRCIKVVLHTGGEERPIGEEEGSLREALGRFAQGSLPTAYGLLREFNALLAATRGRLQDDADTALEAEEERYGQTTDGAWLSERETYYKSLVEARYVAARARLVESLARWWGDVLRFQTAGNGADVSTGVEGLASRLSTAEILRRLSALELLRENLDRNIQEALALEVAFLQVFGT